jgi:pyridoxamine 5'-phosphate oxidase-like protein
MGRVHDGVEGAVAEFVLRQPVFFVATAPSGPDGHVNLSPKGGAGSFAVLDPHTVAYLDMIGSGVETIAHLQENGRIVVMFCAFDGPPRIVRIHGRGSAVVAGEPGYEELASCFPARDGARSVVRVEVQRVADSCGYGVPLMRFEAERKDLDHWVQRKGPEGLVSYLAEKNAESIDGLPGIAPGVPAPAE